MTDATDKTPYAILGVFGIALTAAGSANIIIGDYVDAFACFAYPSIALTIYWLARIDAKKADAKKAKSKKQIKRTLTVVKDEWRAIFHCPKCDARFDPVCCWTDIIESECCPECGELFSDGNEGSHPVKKSVEGFIVTSNTLLSSWDWYPKDAPLNDEIREALFDRDFQNESAKLRKKLRRKHGLGD